MATSMVRLGVVVLAVGAALLVGAGLAWACTPTAEISVRPQAAPAGGYVTVHGERLSAEAGTEVSVRWHTADGQVLATAAGPAFSVGFRVPDVAEGTYAVVATSINGTATQSLTVTPSRPQPIDQPTEGEGTPDPGPGAPDSGGQMDADPEAGGLVGPQPAPRHPRTVETDQSPSRSEPPPMRSEPGPRAPHEQEQGGAGDAAGDPPPAASVPGPQGPRTDQAPPQRTRNGVYAPDLAAELPEPRAARVHDAPPDVRLSTTHAPGTVSGTPEVPWALLGRGPTARPDVPEVAAPGLTPTSPGSAAAPHRPSAAGLGMLSGGLVLLFAGFFVLVVTTSENQQIRTARTRHRNESRRQRLD